MKIIKKGETPGDKVYQATCRHCRTIVEFKQSEGELVTDQRDGDYVKISCPVCNTDICTQVRYS